MYVIYGKLKGGRKSFCPVNVDLAGQLVSSISSATHFYSKEDAEEECANLNKNIFKFFFKVKEVYFYFDAE